MILSNDSHLARALEARRRAGHRDLIQWWATADRRQRAVLARYYQPVRALLGGRNAPR